MVSQYSEGCACGDSSYNSGHGTWQKLQEGDEWLHFSLILSQKVQNNFNPSFRRKPESSFFNSAHPETPDRHEYGF